MEPTLDTVHIDFNSETIWVLNVVLAFVMFGIALDIKMADFTQLIKRPKSVLAGIFSQFVLLPFFTFLLVLLIRPQPSIALGMFLVAACPGGNISNFISFFAKGNVALSVTLTANASLLAIVMTPLNLGLWGSLYGPTNALLKEISVAPSEMLEVVALILGVPLIAGLWIGKQFPKMASMLARYFKIISLIFFISLIFIVMFNNRLLIEEYLIYVLWIVLLHNAVAFFTGYSLSRLLGLSIQDTRSITIETGIQNSGLGLVLVFTFFDGLGGMAILTAFWGIWHLISGLVLGTYWAYRPLRKEEVR
jgi:BASS family bile acid:Na+ symporter